MSHGESFHAMVWRQKSNFQVFSIHGRGVCSNWWHGCVSQREYLRCQGKTGCVVFASKKKNGWKRFLGDGVTNKFFRFFVFVYKYFFTNIALLIFYVFYMIVCVCVSGREISKVDQVVIMVVSILFSLELFICKPI